MLTSGKGRHDGYLSSCASSEGVFRLSPVAPGGICKRLYTAQKVTTACTTNRDSRWGTCYNRGAFLIRQPAGLGGGVSSRGRDSVMAQLLTVRAVAAQLAVSRSSVYKMLQRGVFRKRRFDCPTAALAGRSRSSTNGSKRTDATASALDSVVSSGRKRPGDGAILDRPRGNDPKRAVLSPLVHRPAREAWLPATGTWPSRAPVRRSRRSSRQVPIAKE